MSLIVYGPAGCGKTRNARRLAKHFGLKRVVDEWDRRRDGVVKNALMLTIEAPPASVVCRVLSFDEAMAQASLS